MHEDIGTYKEHLQWCKDRAFALCDQGNASGAWDSMVSDLQKHSGTRNHSAIQLGTMLKMSGFMSTVQETRDFIDGFN